MKILVSETDPVTSRLLCSYLETNGHEVRTENLHEADLRKINLPSYDVLIVSPPYPISSMSAFMNILRDVAGHYPYIAVIVPKSGNELTGHAFESIVEGEAKDGINTAIKKPLDFSNVSHTLENAERLNDFISTISPCDDSGVMINERDDIYQYEYIDGVMALSAFKHVVFCTLDQLARGKTKAGVICVKLKNPDVGKDKALGKALATLHRRSEILGRVGYGYFSILIQGIIKSEEIHDMAQRLADKLYDFEFLKGAKIKIDAMTLPNGELVSRNLITAIGVQND